MNRQICDDLLAIPMTFASADGAAAGAHDRLREIHDVLTAHIMQYGWELRPHRQGSRVISNRSVAAFEATEATEIPVLTYFRPVDRACLIERLMGIENCTEAQHINISRHPVIELRLTPEHFVIELVVPPDAWWDQENLAGKLSVARQRQALRNLLEGMDGDFCCGFWEGTHLDDMHLTVRQLLRGSILDEWLDTFTEARDWFRIGRWYRVDDTLLSTPFSVGEICHQISALYPVYQFLAWTSDNNFRGFAAA